MVFLFGAGCLGVGLVVGGFVVSGFWVVGGGWLVVGWCLWALVGVGGLGWVVLTFLWVCLMLAQYGSNGSSLQLGVSAW